MRTLAQVLAALASAAVLAACARNSAPNGHPAEDSDKVLNVYNWFDYIDRSIIVDFERESGIHVNYDVFDSDEVLETKLMTGHTGYDIVVPSTPVLERAIAAGALRPLDKARLPNLQNLDPETVRFMAIFDPGNRYAVIYTWLNTTGIAYDATQITARVPQAPTDSLRMLFAPELLARFQDCGVAVIDSPVDAVEMALLYLGKNPASESPGDLKAAEAVLMGMRRYVRYIDTGRYMSDLASGEVCLALGWSGDVVQARNRAKEASQHVDLRFSIPREGSVNGADVVAIPVDAPHGENAHRFIDFLLRPEVAARISNTVGYANGVTAAMPLLRPELRNDPVYYPPAEVRSKLYPERARSEAFTRQLTRLWTRFKMAT